MNVTSCQDCLHIYKDATKAWAGTSCSMFHKLMDEWMADDRDENDNGNNEKQPRHIRKKKKTKKKHNNNINNTEVGNHCLAQWRRSQRGDR